MKRVISIMLVLIMTFAYFPKISYAATDLPPNTIIVGDKIYTLSYMENNISEVNSQMNNFPDKVYFVDSEGNLKDKNGMIVSESQIVNTNGRMLTLYSTSSDGDLSYGTKYVANASNEFKKVSSVPTNNKYGYALVDITKSSGTSGNNVVDIKIKSVYGVLNGVYLIVDADGEVDNLNDKKDIYQKISLITSSNQFYFFIYSSNGNLIAKGNVTNITSSVYDYPVLLEIVSSDSITNSYRITGNISNNGLAATDGEFIYYSNMADGGKIYKKSIEGVDEYPITEDNAKFINIVGDYIYYSNLSDGGKIYRIKTDGTERTKLNEVLSSYINVVGDYIYYINGKHNNFIYKMPKDNMNSSYAGYPLTYDRASYLIVSGNVAYYSNLSDKGRLYSFDMLNNIKTQYTVSGSSSIPGVRYISVTNDGILYAAGYDGKLYKSISNGRLLPVSITVNDPKKGQIKDKVTVINAVSSNDIYYRSNVLGGKLYKLDSTGTASLVYPEVATNINVVITNKGTYVYFTKGNKLFSYELGSSEKAIAASKFKPDDKVASVYVVSPLDYSEQLPDRVSAIMADGSIRDLLVNWDMKSAKTKNGITTYKGKIVGYGTSITISKARYSPALLASQVKVYNYEGDKADYITVSGLSYGDEVIAYDSLDATKPLGKAKADKTGVAKIAKLDLDSNGGRIYLALTKIGYAPSNRVSFTYPSEAPTIVKAEYVEYTSGLSLKKVYRITYKGKNGSIKYAFVSNPANSPASYNEASATPQSSNVYYFEIDSNTIDYIGDENGNLYLKIAYDSSNASPSEPYTFLGQPKPNVVYNFNTASFSGLNSSIECSLDGGATWISSQELLSNPQYLLNKTYILARFIPSSNKLPGQIAYVPLIDMPRVYVTAKDTNNNVYIVFDNKDEKMYYYDELSNTLTSKYIANAGYVGLDNIKINVVNSNPNVQYSLYLDGNEVNSGDSLYGKVNVDGLKTINLVLNLTQNYEVIATQNIKLKVFNGLIAMPEPEIVGVLGKVENDIQTAYSARIRVKYDALLTASLKGKIYYENQSPVSYNFYLNDGYWVGEEVYGRAGNYKVEVQYEDSLLVPRAISNNTSKEFKIDTDTVPQVRIKYNNDLVGALVKSKGITDADYKEYISDSTPDVVTDFNGYVILNDFNLSGNTDIEWIENENSTRSLKYSFYVKYQYVGETIWHDAKKDDIINYIIPGNDVTTYRIKVVVINNDNGYTKEFIYEFNLKK